MLEVYEIRIDEVYRMINCHGLNEGILPRLKYRDLEQQVLEDGYAYVVVTMFQYFGNSAYGTRSAVDILDICYDERDMYRWYDRSEPEKALIDDGSELVGCMCTEVWKVRSLTESEAYDEYGYDEQTAMDMDYEDALNTLRYGDIYLENGQFCKAYLDALDYVIRYDPQCRKHTTLRELEELRNACLSF